MLKGTHLPVEVKEIQAGYLHSPYFKDIYQYLLQNKLLSFKLAIKKLGAIAEKYALLDSLLFRICPEKETAVSSDTRNMCGQDNNSVSQKSIYRSSESN